MTARARHHVDGRLGPGLAYVAPDLVIELTPAEHRRLHLLLDDLEASWPRDGESLLLHRARRHAVAFGWAADHGRSLTFGAQSARAMQRLWLDVIAALGSASREGAA